MRALPNSTTTSSTVSMNRSSKEAHGSGGAAGRASMPPQAPPPARLEERQQAIIGGDRNPARDGHCRSCRRVRWGVRDCSVTNLGYGAMESAGALESGAGRADRGRRGEQILTAVVDNGTLIGPANDYGPSEWYMGRLLSHRGDEYKPGAALVWRVQGCSPMPAGAQHQVRVGSYGFMSELAMLRRSVSRRRCIPGEPSKPLSSSLGQQSGWCNTHCCGVRDIRPRSRYEVPSNRC